MKTYRLRLALQSPLSVSGSRDTANRSETRSAVPPTTLRGALAAAVKSHGAGEETMQALFGETGCRTGSLLPVMPGAGDATVTPVPLTLRSCKFKGGFHADGKHGVDDVLFAALHFALHDDGGGLSSARSCTYPGCTHVLKAMSDFVRYDAENGTWHAQGKANSRTQAHVGLDRRRRGAASGILYSRQVISEKTSTGDNGASTLHPTHMQADVFVPSSMSSVLASALTDGQTLRVGTARSRGLGRCTVTAFSEADRSLPTVEERVAAFNDAWTGSCEALGHAPENGGALVACTLETPALFVDDFLRPNLAPGGGDLLQARWEEEADAAEVLTTLERVHQIARPATLQSWNGLARFPHPSAQGLQAGSVLVFRAPDRTDALFDALAHIETYGIGLRRHFGFGRVRVCNPLHTHIHEHTDAAPQAA